MVAPQSATTAAGTIAAQFGYSPALEHRRLDRLHRRLPVISTYYTMIAGWVLAYTWFFASGSIMRHGGPPVAVRKVSRVSLPIRAPWRYGSSPS